MIRSFFFPVALVVFVFQGWLLGQQQPPMPQLISIFPAGGKTGETTVVKIVEQSELEFSDELLFSHPGITSKPKLREKNRFFPSDTPMRNEFLVRVDKSVPPGIYQVRAKCEYGISNPRRFVVSDSTEILETEPNDGFDQANEIDVNGIANGVFEAGYDFYRLKVVPGQSLIFRCVAEQIDSIGDPVIAVFDSQRKLIGKNHDANGKDALYSFRASREEEIYIRVNDLTFVSQRGAGTTPYRLVVSSGPWIDFVDPPVIPKNIPTKVRLVGRNLGGGQSGIYRDGIELESLEVTLNSNNLEKVENEKYSDIFLAPSSYSRDRMVYRYAAGNGISNPVLIDVCQGKLSREMPEANQLNLGNDVLASFSKQGEVDHYYFEGTKDEKIWIEITSQRLGKQTDPLIVIEKIQTDQKGADQFRQVATVDDIIPLARPFRLRLDTEDAATLFTVPEDGSYRISIIDQFNLPENYNGPNYYKLTFRRPEPRVDLVAIPGLECGNNDNHARALKITPCIVRPDGTAEIQVFAYRSPGFKTDISLQVTGLPAGVVAEPCSIGTDSNHGTILLSGAADLKTGYARVQITGKYTSAGKEIVVPVAGAEVVTNAVGNEPSESRLTDEIVVIADANIEFPGRINLSGKTFETAVGGTVDIKAKLDKRKTHTGAILQGFVHGLPQTVTKNTNTIPDDGKEVDYKLNFRQGIPPGEYSAFIRGYFEKNTKRYENKYKELESEQKRLVEVSRLIETEYRKTTNEKNSMASKVALQKQLLTMIKGNINAFQGELSRASIKIAKDEKKIEPLEKEQRGLADELASLAEMANLEKDPANKKQIEEKKVVLNKRLMDAKTKITSARQELEKAKAKKLAHQTELDKQLEKQKQTEKEQKLMEIELEKLNALEQKLADERAVGQNLKREFDQEFNLARQATQDRRRRFLVYSDPIRIRVAEFPIELTLSETLFRIQQGQSKKIKIKVNWLFGFKGPATVQLRPLAGSSGFSFSKDVKLTGDSTEQEAEIVVQKNAKVGKMVGELRATMRFGTANLTQSIPVELDITAAPATK